MALSDHAVADAVAATLSAVAVVANTASVVHLKPQLKLAKCPGLWNHLTFSLQ